MCCGKEKKENTDWGPHRVGDPFQGKIWMGMPASFKNERKTIRGFPIPVSD